MLASDTGARVIEEAHDEQQENRAEDGDDEAPEVKAGDAGATHGADDEAAAEAADDADHDVAKQSESAAAYQAACQPAGESPKHDPTQNTHVPASSSAARQRWRCHSITP